jgi:Zn-finger in ubiquitin-hydrolases and other protein
MSEPTCSHLDTIADIAPSGNGCVECLANGTAWVHLRRCAICGHVGCCDSSPKKHATGHFRTTNHAIVQSFEPGEDWLWCFVDEFAFEIDSMTPGPSHT